MKKVLLMIVAVLSVAFSLTSCHDIKEHSKGQYVFWEPCLKWDSDMDQIKSFMGGQSGWKMNFSTADNIEFTNGSLGAKVDYNFKDGKLYYVELGYINCPEEFDHMANDWATKYNFTWDSNHYANIEPLHCLACIWLFQTNGDVWLKMKFEK